VTRFTAIREVPVRLRGGPGRAPANAVVNFGDHTVSLVAVISDVVRDGKPVVGVAFNSIGRFAQSGILRDRVIPRVLAAGKMNYWESGMDMNYGDDLFDSFVAYQSELIEQFNVIAEEQGFVTLDATQDERDIQQQLRHAVGDYLAASNGAAKPSMLG